VSPSPSALRAIEWLERQRADLGGIRNATSRDPIFKNWRQVTLTTLQRIWPGDRTRLERFLRIPFSPPETHADVRAQREWYSRGCHEAVRVLNGLIEDIRAHGVPEVPDEVVMGSGGSSGEFEVDFPTVDLPAGDLGSGSPSSGEASNPFADFVDSAPRADAADLPAPPPLPRAEGAGPAGPGTSPAAPRSGRKGLNMRARLLDLLGFSQLSAKAFSPPPRESPSSANLPSLDLPAAAPTQPVRDLDIVPLGGAVVPRLAPPTRPLQVTPTGSPEAEAEATPAAPPAGELPAAETPRPSGAWPLPRAGVPSAEAHGPTPEAPPRAAGPAPEASPPAPVGPAPAGHEPEAAASTPATPDASAPPAAAEPRPYEPGVSVVMSRPTTLRGAIEKVTIESLLSDSFRDTAPAAETPPGPVPASAAPVTPAASGEDTPATLAPAPGAHGEEPTERPVVPVPEAQAVAPQAVPASASAPEQGEPLEAPEIEVGAPVEELLSASPPAGDPDPAEEDEPERAPRSRILPLPRRRSARSGPAAEDADADSAVGRVDPEAFARATEDFMRSSPVLGATGRRVKRARDAERGRARERDRERDASGYQDPDAIAIAAMVDDLDDMKVPASRRQETRARLKDLAARIEKGELEWPALKKAVWFAMEHPELARRLVPVLLPWFDRAA